MKTVKNLFLYLGLLVVLVLSTNSITNVQPGGGRNSEKAQVLVSQGQQQGCGNTGHTDSGGIGSGDESGGSNNNPSCGGESEASVPSYELLSILLFGTVLIGAGVAVRRLRF